MHRGFPAFTESPLHVGLGLGAEAARCGYFQEGMAAGSGKRKAGIGICDTGTGSGCGGTGCGCDGGTVP